MGAGVVPASATVYTVRDGRCVRKLELKRRSEALAAAGLDP